MPHRANGQYVSNADALKAWTPFARDVLLETARSYRGVLTRPQLADAVQRRSGIASDQPVGPWIGKLLERVSVLTDGRDEPPLAALCVHDDGSIGDEYRISARSAGDAADSTFDRERLAAEHRLLCYQAYADDLPADGGEISVHRPPPRPAARQRASPSARRPAASVSTRREVTCHECFLIVAAGPTCSSCGAPLPQPAG